LRPLQHPRLPPDQPVGDRLRQRQPGAELAHCGPHCHQRTALPHRGSPHPALGAHQDCLGLPDVRRSGQARFAVVRLQPAVLLADLHALDFAPVPQHRPRAGTDVHRADRCRSARRLAPALQRHQPQPPVQRSESAAVAQLEPRDPDGRRGKGRSLRADRPSLAARARRSRQRPVACAFTRSCSAATATRCWTTTAAAPC